MVKVKLDKNQIEELIQNNEIVYSLYWDSGSPGAGADIEAIYKHKDKYCPVLSFEDEVYAYDSFDEAILATELNVINETTMSIESIEITPDKLIEKLEYQGDENHKILINKTEYFVREGKFINIEKD